LAVVARLRLARVPLAVLARLRLARVPLAVLARVVDRDAVDRVVVVRAVLAARGALGLRAAARLVVARPELASLGLASLAAAARVVPDRAVLGSLAVARLGAALLAVVLRLVLLPPLAALLLAALLLAVLRLVLPRVVPVALRLPVARVRLLPAAGLPDVSVMSLCPSLKTYPGGTGVMTAQRAGAGHIAPTMTRRPQIRVTPGG
jgi:hypothetical protein